MNGFSFFRPGLDFPPRTVIGYLWIVTEGTPEKMKTFMQFFSLSVYHVSSQKVVGCLWSRLDGIS